MHLRVTSLSLKRGPRTLVSGLSFAVGASEALVLRGPNGVGKTTLLRAIAGFVTPAAGTVAVEDGDPERTVGEQCHFIGHQNAIKGALTVAENCAFWRSYQPVADAGVTAASTQAALERLGIRAIADIPAAYLSAGQKRRLALTRLIVMPRPIWLLDEPTVSLDAESTAILARLIADHVSGGGLVVAATHIDLGLSQARELRLERAPQDLEAAWDRF